MISREVRGKGGEGRGRGRGQGSATDPQARHTGAAAGDLEGREGTPGPKFSLGSPQAYPGLLWFPADASGLHSPASPDAALMALPRAPGTSPPPRLLCQPPCPLAAETQSSAAALAQQNRLQQSRPACLVGRTLPGLCLGARSPAPRPAEPQPGPGGGRAGPARPVPPHPLLSWPNTRVTAA